VGLPVRHDLYCHVLYHGWVSVDVPEGLGFTVLSRGGGMENGLYWEGLAAHEPTSMGAWLRASRQARTVLDIGANVGVFALAAAAAGAKNVHAFEPMPRIHAALAQNVARNGTLPVRTWRVAVADAEGTAAMYDPGGDLPTSASLSRDFAQHFFGELPAVQVPVVRVDAWVAAEGIAHVDLIKLDVEGHEAAALRGMRETVLRVRPTLLVDVLGIYEAEIRALVTDLFGDLYVWERLAEGRGTEDRNVLLTPREARV
jgi:FkbM family methyltransferase